jgi:F420-0:gamma-glutamyl ligase
MPREKEAIRLVEGRAYLRIPVHTHVVTEADDIVAVAQRYAGPLLQPGDVLFAAEKTVAITQGRAIPIATMHPGVLARTLWRFVRQTSYGVGLRDPYSMQAAIDEAGGVRIVLAAIVGGLTRAFGRRGDFYRIAGMQAAAIDAPGTAGIEQFRDRVIKGPKDPDGVARRLREALGCEAAVVDCNDIDSAVLGHSQGVDARIVRLALLDNPLGQGAEQTPLGILRDVTADGTRRSNGTVGP